MEFICCTCNGFYISIYSDCFFDELVGEVDGEKLFMSPEPFSLEELASGEDVVENG
jgi:hypothetical protein